MLIKSLPFPAGGDGVYAGVFLTCATFFGVGSALSGLMVLYYKFDLIEAVSSKSMSFGRVHYIPIYFSLLYLITGAIGSWASYIRL